eukprot:scaffold262652_cov33-Tisochrysis_lutea.AAC.1
MEQISPRVPRLSHVPPCPLCSAFGCELIRRSTSSRAACTGGARTLSTRASRSHEGEHRPRSLWRSARSPRS